MPAVGQEVAAEVLDLDGVCRRWPCRRAAGRRARGAAVSTGTNSVPPGSRVGVGDGPDDPVVVGEHGDREAGDRGVAGDREHDVGLAVVLQRRLDLGERAGHGQRIERRDLVAAQVEALVGLGARQVRADERGGDDGPDDDHGAEHQAGPVRADVAAGLELVAGAMVTARGARRCPAVISTQRAGEDAGALGERQPALLDREQQAQGEGQDRADRRAARGAATQRAISPPMAAASQATVNGSARSCWVMSAGGALDSRSAQPSTRPRAKCAVRARRRQAADGDPAEHDEGDRREGDALAEQQASPAGDQHDGRRADGADGGRRSRSSSPTARCGRRRRR